MGTATGASSAAPTFFDPKTHINGYNMKELQIDGGVICNNPALYAYEFARLLMGKQKIRVLSLGTGEKPFKPFASADDFTKLTYMSKLSEFMMNMDVYTSHYKLLNVFNMVLKRPDDYLRLQKTSKVGMDKIDAASINELVSDGTKIYEDPVNQPKIEAMISTILDEKYGTIA